MGWCGENEKQAVQSYIHSLILYTQKLCRVIFLLCLACEPCWFTRKLLPVNISREIASWDPSLIYGRKKCSLPSTTRSAACCLHGSVRLFHASRLRSLLLGCCRPINCLPYTLSAALLASSWLRRLLPPAPSRTVLLDCVAPSGS